MTRDELILSLGPKVRRAVDSVFRNIRTAVEREDMISEAWIGAIAAVDSFEAGRGLTLSTYAEYKIRGRILDYLRSMDVVGRKQRQKIKAGTETAPKVIPMQQMHDGFDVVDANGFRGIASFEARHDLGRIVGRANLRRRDRALLRRRFWHEQSQREIARVFGVSESRVSQVANRVFRSLVKSSRLPAIP